MAIISHHLIQNLKCITDKPVPATSSVCEDGKHPIQDYIAICQLAFEWADSYDKKDWNRLRNILAPNLMVDYSIIGHQCFPHMKPEEFISMMSSPKLLGDPLVHTQHLLGAAKYEWVSETEIVAVYHIRAAPQHYTNLDLAIGATSMALLSTGMGRLMESGSLLECVRSFIGLSMTFPRSSPNHLHRKGQEALFS